MSSHKATAVEFVLFLHYEAMMKRRFDHYLYFQLSLVCCFICWCSFQERVNPQWNKSFSPLGNNECCRIGFLKLFKRKWKKKSNVMPVNLKQHVIERFIHSLCLKSQKKSHKKHSREISEKKSTRKIHYKANNKNFKTFALTSLNSAFSFVKYDFCSIFFHRDTPAFHPEIYF